MSAKLLGRPDIVRLAETDSALYTRIERLLLSLADDAYKLMPWLVREVKRGHVGDASDGDILDTVELADELLRALRDHPTERVPDINRLPFGALESLLDGMAHFARPQWEERHVVFRCNDGWRVEAVRDCDDFALEGELMGHCVADYTDDSDRGEVSIYSLRDAKGRPYATVAFSWSPLRQESVIQVEQLQGKQNKPLHPACVARLKEWFGDLRKQGYEVLLARDETAFELLSDFYADFRRRADHYARAGGDFGARPLPEVRAVDETESLGGLVEMMVPLLEPDCTEDYEYRLARQLFAYTLARGEKPLALLRVVEETIDEWREGYRTVNCKLVKQELLEATGSHFADDDYFDLAEAFAEELRAREAEVAAESLDLWWYEGGDIAPSVYAFERLEQCRDYLRDLVSRFGADLGLYAQALRQLEAVAIFVPDLETLAPGATRPTPRRQPRALAVATG
jgi:hypothetical protein